MKNRRLSLLQQDLENKIWMKTHGGKEVNGLPAQTVEHHKWFMADGQLAVNAEKLQNITNVVYWCI